MRKHNRRQARTLITIGLIAAAFIIGHQTAGSDPADLAEIGNLQQGIEWYDAALKAATDENVELQQVLGYTQDYQDLCGTVEAEARGQSYEGKRAVAEVVINRVKDPGFGDTISEVLNAPGQFTAAAGTYSLETQAAVDQALQEQRRDALYFMNPDTASKAGRDWMRTKTLVTTIGSHEFYK